MTFRRAIPRPTPEQQARQDAARALGCLACRIERESGNEKVIGTECGWIEIHHLTNSGRTISQDHTIALGTWHHRAMLKFHGFWNSSQMTEIFGPSLAKGSKTFHARYGDNQTLLELQDRLIRENS